MPSSNTTIALDVASRQVGVEGARLTAKIQKLYSLLIWDVRTSAVLAGNNLNLNPANPGSSAEFFFSVPPKVIEVTEPYASTIIPTQDGSKYVESHGSILKQIRVQGTTGLRPHKGLTDIPLLTTSTSALAAATGLADAVRSSLPTSEATGFDAIVFLKNIFRKYSDLKEAGEGRYVRLVWMNAKDQEYWIVEPTEFGLSQSSDSPLTYQYQMSLTTLSRFDGAPTQRTDVLTTIMSHKQLFTRFKESSKTLLRTTSSLIAARGRFEVIGVDLASDFIGPLFSVLRAVRSVQVSVDRPLHLFSGTSDLLAKFIDAYDHFTDNHTKLVGADPTDPNNIADLPRRSLLRGIVALAHILRSIDPDGQLSAQQRADRAASRYAQERDPLTITGDRSGPSVAASSAFIGNQRLTGAVSVGTVTAYDTIRSLALRYLGDAAQWHSIVLLNDLRSPYVVADKSSTLKHVLKPGDTFVYPVRGGSPQSTNASANPSAQFRESEESYDSPVHHAYGTDIRLKSTSDGLTDLAVSQLGDVSMVRGTANVVQGVKLKFQTEQGALPAHAYYGAKFPIGKKMTSSSFNSFRINTRRTVLSDNRVKHLNRLEFIAVNDNLLIDADIVLVDSNETLTTSFVIRKF
tara:strand:- start:3824 stop:5716 length:1893 start_codon:yes stop_codon:yes gene_type:complete